jgi:hypothetical protein
MNRVQHQDRVHVQSFFDKLWVFSIVANHHTNSAKFSFKAARGQARCLMQPHRGTFAVRGDQLPRWTDNQCGTMAHRLAGGAGLWIGFHHFAHGAQTGIHLMFRNNACQISQQCIADKGRVFSFVVCTFGQDDEIHFAMCGHGFFG